jgi:peptidyl-prolyl cis-trans isomerase C
MEGKDFHITYGDVVDVGVWKKTPNPEWIKQQLRDRGEMVLAAMAAERDGADVSGQFNRYLAERLPALTIEKKTRDWIPNEKTMRSWYKKHQEVGRIPASYHVGQLVVATKEEAQAMRARIVKGESLFNLAASDSIDPEGRKRNGDMGWIAEGRGMPELLNVLPKLKDEQLSDIITTPAGFNLIMVLERRIGRQKPFEDVRERVQQMMISQNLPGFLGELEKRYPVTWSVIAAQPVASQPVAAQ